jgi:hypothetical protein
MEGVRDIEEGRHSRWKPSQGRTNKTGSVVFVLSASAEKALKVW